MLTYKVKNSLNREYSKVLCYMFPKYKLFIPDYLMILLRLAYSYDHSRYLLRPGRFSLFVNFYRGDYRGGRKTVVQLIAVIILAGWAEAEQHKSFAKNSWTTRMLRRF